MKKLIIGLTLDSQQPGGFSRFPWYAIRSNYCSTIFERGGIAFPIAHNLESIESICEVIDGLVITGGNRDIHPNRYGIKEIHPSIVLDEERTEFELALFFAFFKTKKPIIGICGGCQLINVALGGTLIQHIPDEVDKPCVHKKHLEDPYDVQLEKHGISVNGIFSCWYDNKDAVVNSSHHQAVLEVGDGLAAGAWAPDGIIEGVYHTTHPFCLGVQWHPEFVTGDSDDKLLKAFMDACKKRISQ
jgi:putative glutamine amidotransferase